MSNVRGTTKRNDGVFIVYPDRRFVPANTIFKWYCDAVANGEAAAGCTTLAQQAEALHQTGIITLRRT